MIQTVFVYADDLLDARVDAGLLAGCRLLDTHLRNTGFDGFGHTAQFLDFLNVFPSLVSQFVGQCFYVVRTAPRVYVLTNLRFFLNVNLSITCNTCREVGRKGNRFVQCVGMQ